MSRHNITPKIAEFLYDASFLALFVLPVCGVALGWLIGVALWDGRVREGATEAEDLDTRRETGVRGALLGGLIGLVAGLWIVQDLWV